MRFALRLPLAILSALLIAAACAPADPHVLTFAGSAVGAEGQAIARQLDRFHAAHPSVRVALRATPDAADQRHQLYVQWLNAHAPDPDVLQLDVVWTPEFAAAGWVVPLDAYRPDVDDFFPAAIAASRWNGRLFALPWFIDAGLLYWRTDLMPRAPVDLDELERTAQRLIAAGAVPYGLVWQGARYEGIVTVFLEYLGAYGGQIMDEAGRVVVASHAAVAALTRMRDEVATTQIVPAAALTWQEEHTRFAFQNGQAAFMRNWPYAYRLLQDAAQSTVAGRVAIAPMPGGPSGAPTAALGGSVLAVNRFSADQAEAYALVQYLLEPEQLLERTRIASQFPPRPSLYDMPALEGALPIDPREARRVLEHTVARPATPVYTELSEALQIALHEALTGQRSPRAALTAAASSMQAILDGSGLGRPSHAE